MAWIKTVNVQKAELEHRQRLIALRKSFPPEYGLPAPDIIPGGESIVDSHSLIPEAQYHAFMTMGALMSEDLPLSRRQHEMIATIVSETNDCFY